MAECSYETHELFPPHFSLNNIETQLAVFKAAFNINEEIFLKYLDDENDEVGIFTDADLKYAYDIIINSKTNNNTLRYVIRNNKGEILAKPKLMLDSNLLKEADVLNKIELIKQDQKDPITIEDFGPKTSSEMISTIPKDFTFEQLNWLKLYLDNFKKEILNEVEQRLRQLPLKRSNLNDDLISLDFDDDSDISFELKVQKLLLLLLRAKSQDRHLKVAYLEEELLSTGAFCASFIKDHNIPDGTKCEPSTKFRKTWLIKNTGKVSWSDDNFNVKLVNISGNINTTDRKEYVDVPTTLPNESVNVSVDLIAPNHPGKYSTEWVLTCNGFTFGPRIWCSIEVVDDVLKEKNDVNPVVQSFSANSSQNLLNLDATFSDNISNINGETSDDEFVVVPDCFDLTKKWKKTDQFENLNKISENTNKENEHLRPDETLIDLSTSKADESSSSEIQVLLPSPSSSITTEANQNDLLNNLTIETNRDYKNQPEISNSIDLVKLIPATNLTNDSASNKSENNLSSAFDLMKNAFSNLGRPSYVTNFDLIETSPQASAAISPRPFFFTNKSDARSLLHKEPTNDMEKLIDLGFADRALNEKLLKKHDGDLNKVIQSILDIAENNWHESRY